MSDPYAARHVLRHYPGALDGQSRRVTPRSPLLKPPRRREPALPVWGMLAGFGEVEWWKRTGNSGTTFDPPDPDADGSLFFPGGSDGVFHYLAVKDGGQWYVDKFDKTLTTLLDRWPITGWTSYLPTSDVQHVCVGGSRVVVIAEDTAVEIVVAVFDLAGTLLDTWSYDTTPDVFPPFDVHEQLQTATGSCTDGSSVFFGLANSAGTTGANGDSIVAIDLSTGALSYMVSVYDDVDPYTSGSIIAPTGLIVLPGGDLIFAGSTSIVRVTPPSTLVWELTGPELPTAVDGVAHAGTGMSLWGSAEDPGPPNEAYEISYGGALLRTVPIPEPAVQAWLGPK